jgi:hypothetical protein
MLFRFPRLVLPFSFTATFPFPFSYPDARRQSTPQSRASANAGTQRRRVSGPCNGVRT